MRPTSLLRTLALCVSALALASAPSLAAAPAAAPRNLLANPGFEKSRPNTDWMPAAWDTSASELETVFFGRDSVMVHSGKYAVNVANTSTLYPMGHNWSQALLVKPEWWGKTAVFSVWTKSNGLQGRAYVLVQAYRDTISKQALIWGVDRDEAQSRLGIPKISDPLRDLGWQRTAFEDPQTDWVRREARAYVCPGTNMLFVRCGLMGTGQVLFDDASLTLEATPPVKPVAEHVNLLADPGFEQGGLAWEWSAPPFEGLRIERDTTVAHTGHVSMRCSHMDQAVVTARAGLCQVVRAEALRGKRVRMSGWYKADSLTAPAYSSMTTHSLTETKPSGATGLLTDTFDWTYNSTEMDVPADACVLWAWLAASTPAAGTLWLDDATLEVIGPATGAAPVVKPAARPATKPPGAKRKP